LLLLVDRFSGGEGSRNERDATRKVIMAAASEEGSAEAQYVHGLLHLRGQWEEEEIPEEIIEDVVSARQSVLEELKDLKKKAKLEKKKRRAEERKKKASSKSEGMVIHAKAPAAVTAPPDPLQIARKSLERAAVQGYQKAQAKLGLLLLDTDEPGESAMAVEWLELAVGTQHATPDLDALLYLGLLLIDSDEADISERAMQYLVLAAEAGQTDAQFWVGHYNRVGHGTIRIDGVEAVRWLSAAAMGTSDTPGLGKAMHYLAQLYGEGDADAGIATDSQLAWKWLRAGEANGYGDTLFHIGDLHYHGSTQGEDAALPIDRRLAARYYFRATGLLSEKIEPAEVEQAGGGGADEKGDDAEDSELRDKVVQAMRGAGMDVQCWLESAGGGAKFEGEGGQSEEEGGGLHADALASLAAMFYHGDGVTQNHHLAFMLYQRAAVDNHFISWRNIASMYALGHGVEKDEQTAKYLLDTLREQMREALEEQGGELQPDAAMRE
jgi:TPR repeat protein